MDGEYLLRIEHEEYRRTMESEHKRLQDEDERQNKRLDILEKEVRQIAQIAASVERLATNMEHMVEEQAAQGKRLENLEGRDGDKWRTSMRYIGTTILGFILALLWKHLMGG